MKIDLTPSGVEAVDSTLGGLIANDITLLCGPPRAGKTIAGLNHLIWLLRQRAPAMLVTTDLPEAVIELAHSFFEVDIRNEIEQKRLTILTLAPNFTNRLRSLGTVARAFDELAMLCEERHIKHLVFDTIDPVLAAITVTNVKRFVQEALAAVRSMGVTLLCTSRAEGDGALRMGVQELSGRVATTLQLSTDPARMLVASASWSNTAGSTVDVQLVAGQGLVASGTTPRADIATTAPAQPSPARGRTPAPQPRWSNQVNTLHVDGGAAVFGREPAPDPIKQVAFGKPLPSPKRGGVDIEAGGLDAMPTRGVQVAPHEVRLGPGAPAFDDSEGSRAHRIDPPPPKKGR